MQKTDRITFCCGFPQIAEGATSVDNLPDDKAVKFRKVTGYMLPEARFRGSEAVMNQPESNFAAAELKAKDIQIRYLLLLTLSSFIVLIGILFYYRKQVAYLQKVIDRNMNVAKTLGIESQMLLKDNEIGVESERYVAPPHRHKALFEKINSLITDKKIFRDPDLSLGKITELVGSNRTYVSEAINVSTEMKFNDYVNFHRINEAKKLIKEESSISEVQYACGFNSRTSFYSAFKKFAHMTPSEFSKMYRNR